MEIVFVTVATRDVFEICDICKERSSGIIA